MCVCVCRYVLISRPSEWSDQLRIKFLEGFEAFLELLKCMQVTHTWRHAPDTYLDRCSLSVSCSDPVCLSVSGYGPGGETGGAAHRDGA